jgi:hypothetical protein
MIVWAAGWSPLLLANVFPLLPPGVTPSRGSALHLAARFACSLVCVQQMQLLLHICVVAEVHADLAQRLAWLRHTRKALPLASACGVLVG